MIRKIDSNIFSLTILKVTTFSRIRHGDVHGKYIITDPQHPFYNRTIDEYMNSRLKPVKTIDDKIRNHKNYKFIKVSYEDIMALFNEKVAKIIQDPQNLSFSR